MKLRLLRLTALMLALVCLAGAATAAAPGVSAQRAILTEANSGRVLYQKDADRQSRIASTTKIMTALVVAERCEPEEQVHVASEAVGVEGSSIYLRAGEVLTVRELLYGLLLQSGNDAAVALAVHCAGSTPAFVDLMNEKAQELGLKHTHFMNPNGLDAEGHYSTARDLSILGACAMKNDLIREITSTKTYKFGERCLSNHNKLLWRYEGAVGIKTGFTKKAGRILVSSAERGGRRLIAVTINAPDDWRDHTKLLDYGFSQFTETTLVEEGQLIRQVPLLSGGSARLVAQEGFTFPLLPDEEPELRVITPPYAWSREELQKACVRITLNGEVIGEVALRVQ